MEDEDLMRLLQVVYSLTPSAIASGRDGHVEWERFFVLTVVELDIVPVNEGSNSSVDGQVGTTRELSGGEPGRDGGMCYDVVTWMKSVR